MVNEFEVWSSPSSRPNGQRAWRGVYGAFIALGVLALAPLALRWWTDHRYSRLIYPLDQVPPRRVAIVFGAGVWPDGRLSDVLADRVDTAIALYQAGKAQKLLMTGDNRFINYNEPGHMRAYALARGVPDEDIVLDYAGRRTYDSCYRARYIFEVTDAILVTQAYHLDRALFLAHSLGIDAVGVAADRRPYLHIRRYWWRELVATAVAQWEVK
ncbi:MAG: YdcF family protein, partial [Chloroflexi bacterium]|nr:YdcF family protein [Chloroflexota bacterium]